MSDKAEIITKAALLKSIFDEHGLLEMTLARLTHAQMMIPGVEGDWSIKDILAHISAWERRMINWTCSLIQNEEPTIPTPWDVDRMNAETFLQVKDKTLAEVLEEFRQTYWDSLALVESLNEEQLNLRYTETWPMGLLWTGIAANMNWHYNEHREDIQKWLASKKQER